MEKIKVLIAMSGGVDSSVAAYLTIQSGVSCVGATMRLHESNDTPSQVEDARSVAQRLNIPFYALDFQDEFRCLVMDSFVRSYESGQTPNPCIECNRCIKFGHLLQQAQALGCSHIATGHYARVTQDPTLYFHKL